MGNGAKLRVVLDSAYQDKITFKSGAEIYQDTWLNSERKTTLWGTVVFVPFRKTNCPMLENGNACPQCEEGTPCDHSPKAISQDIKVGDKICIRYDVVADGDPTESGRVHNNLVFLPYINAEGKQDIRPEWMVDYTRVLLVERNGVQEVVGNHVLCENVQLTNEKVSTSIPGFVLPESAKTEVIPHQLKVVNIGANQKGIQAGDTVLVNPAIVQHYNISGIYGQDNAIISHRHIMAKIVAA